jgi:hypothetical protein
VKDRGCGLTLPPFTVAMHGGLSDEKRHPIRECGYRRRDLQSPNCLGSRLLKDIRESALDDVDFRRSGSS